MNEDVTRNFHSEKVLEQAETLKETPQPETEVVPEVDPLAAEKALIEAQEQEALNRSPEDVAAAMFSNYFPLFKNSLNQCSKNSLKKLLVALIEVPLNSRNVSLLNKNEKTIFQVGSRLLEAKWEMMLYTLKKHQEDFEKAEAENKAQENLTPETEPKKEN